MRGIRFDLQQQLMAGAAIVATAVATPAQAQTRDFDVPAHAASRSIPVFARQAGVQIIASGNVVRGRRTNAVRGSYTVEDGLRALLQGTGLEAGGADGTGIITIRAAGARPGRPAGRLESTPSTGGSPQSGEGRAGGAAADSESADQDIVVTGTNIRGQQAAGAPVIRITREEIDRSGYGRIQDFFELLPQNFTGVSEDFSQAGTSNLARATEIQLRGLGPGTTLTLINGHRQAPGGALGAFSDISSIPASAIERVEILTDGASAIYGSDAIGGVVNFILRKDLNGGETRARFASSRGDAEEVQLGQLLGTTWNGGHVLAGYQYYRREALLGGERPYSAAGGDLRSFGGSDRRREVIGAVPGNIVNSSGQVLFAIPSGQDGTALRAADLLPGQINYFDGSEATLLPRQEIHSAFLSAGQALGETVDLELNVRFVDRRSRFNLGGPTTTVVVPSTNPFYVNPAGGTAPVRVEYDFANDFGGGTTDDGHSRTFAADLSANIALTQAWKLRLTGTYGRERVVMTRTNLRNDAAIALALADSNRATALNVFGDGTANNPATIAGIKLTRFDDGTSEFLTAGATADGPLFDLGGGEARLALGVDRQHHSYHLVSTFQINGDTRSQRNVTSGFAELSLPLIGDGTRAGTRLAASLAGRFDDYSDAGSTFNPKFGLSFRPIDAVTLRATWGTAFRAPPFYLSNQDIRPDRISVSNLPSPTGPTRTLLINGVSPDLREETAEVWTAGIDFSPARAFTLSFTYFDIAYQDRIQVPGTASTLLAFESEYTAAGVISRNPSQAQIDALCNRPGVTANCSGPIAVLVDNRIRNIAAVTTSGIDVAARYAFETGIGSFDLALSGTHTFELKEAVTETATPIDFVDTLGRPLALRMRGNVGWSSGGWRASASVSHAGGYRIPATGNRVTSSTIVDVVLGHDFRSVLRGLTIQVAATNIFDELPPFVDQYSGYDAANGSILGRTLSLQVVQRW